MVSRMNKKDLIKQKHVESNQRILLSEESKHSKIFNEVLHDFRLHERNFTVNNEEQIKAATIDFLPRVTQTKSSKVLPKEAERPDYKKFSSLKKVPDVDSMKEKFLQGHSRIRLSTLNIDDHRAIHSMYSKEDLQGIEEEVIQSELNEKEAHFEKSVKDFRLKYEKTSDLAKLQGCYRVLGTEFLERNNVKESLKYFQAFKVLCDRTKTYTLKMLAYKEIGFCYKLVKQYRSALINFKKLLCLAWLRRHKGWELKSYDFIGLVYYYLGELEKSRYYHRRMWEGVFEGENSTVRILSVNALKLKMEAKSLNEDRGLPQIKDESSYVINQSDDEENDLPSPRTGSGEENLKLLPFYTPKQLPVKLTHLSPPNRISSRKNTFNQSLTNRVRPFMLISHLSPNESPNNYFYVEQMSSFRSREIRQ